MNKKEKILLLELLLEDIRGNWGWENSNRKDYAIKLTNEILDVKGMNELKSTIEAYEHGEDGRYFRDIYPYGYENMVKLHGLNFTLKDKSKEFQQKALQYLTYPEYRFEDIED